MITWFAILLLIAAPVLAWRRRVGRRPGNPVEDPDLLADAEDDVRGLEAFDTPEDAGDLPDWGPGAPR